MHNNSRKKGVSVRMNTDDLEQLKEIAVRLSVRDSDVIRYAVKSMLKRLSPLTRADSGTRELLPVFIEHGAELARAFDLSTESLASVINNGNRKGARSVEKQDIELLAISGSPEGYQQLQIKEVVSAGEDARDVNELLRTYLYNKYLNDSPHALKQGSEIRFAPGEQTAGTEGVTNP